ncbi:MAG: PhoH family protein, partial [Thermoleophilia bacterium]
MAADVRVTDELESNSLALALAGEHDAHLRVLAQRLDCTVTLRGNQLIFAGSPANVAKARSAIHELLTVIRSGRAVNPAMVESLMDIAVSDGGKPSEVYGDIVLSHRGRQIGPRTTNQKVYVDAIRANTITFGIGPAGTGKTYLAAAYGAHLLYERRVERLILSRPALEAGERLGFLP